MSDCKVNTAGWCVFHHRYHTSAEALEATVASLERQVEEQEHAIVETRLLAAQNFDQVVASLQYTGPRGVAPDGENYVAKAARDLKDRAEAAEAQVADYRADLVECEGANERLAGEVTALRERAEAAEADLKSRTRFYDEALDGWQDEIKRRGVAERDRDEARAALRGLYALVEEGWLVRNTRNDAHFPSYMAEATRLTKALSVAEAVLRGASQGERRP